MTDPSGPRAFPPGFVWGTATAAYQIEGAWDQGGKSRSIWDAFTQTPGHVSDDNNGDVACDSYNRYMEDIACMKQLGVTSYRMSLSWPRIIPDPFSGVVNEEGVAYYNRVIDALLDAGISPCVTLYHWDLPLVLEERFGGWASEEIIPFFLTFARTAFSAFGDRVKMWITFNEPSIFIYLGYVLGYHAPGRKDLAGPGPYACVHNVVRAHAQVYRMYQKEFKTAQNGQVGITLNSDWAEPQTDSADDKAAAERYMAFRLGAFAHPIFVDGDYPQTLKQRMATRPGDADGNSRLPCFTEEEKAYIKGSADFFGLNYYTTRYSAPDDKEGENSYKGDCNFKEITDPKWTRGQSVWLYSVPWGLRKLLNYIRENYGAPVVYVTENGFSDPPGTMEDVGRQTYIKDHLGAILDAVEDGVDVRGYYCWTLLDNFEWAEGFNERFGLFHVDIASPARTRSPKQSAAFFRQIATTNTL